MFAMGQNMFLSHQRYLPEINRAQMWMGPNSKSLRITSLLLDRATIVFLLFQNGLRRATIVLERATFCFRTGYAGLP